MSDNTIVHAGPEAAPEAAPESVPVAPPMPAAPPAPRPAAPVAPAVAVSPTGAVVLTDAKGRQLTLRAEPNFLQQMDLLEVAGSARADNQIWMLYFQFAARVAEIDGVALPWPKNDPTIRRVLQAVGTEGVAAVGQYLVPDMFKDPDDDDGAPARAPDDEALSKN